MENKIGIERSWCKGCGVCVAFCPKGILALDKDGKAVAARPEDCVGCGVCERYCPDLAITVGRKVEGGAA